MEDAATLGELADFLAEEHPELLSPEADQQSRKRPRSTGAGSEDESQSARQGTRERNRAAAAKSRQKKQNRLAGLEAEVATLQDGLKELAAENSKVKTENSSLRAQVSNLSELLFRIGSSVRSEDFKKVSLGMMSALAAGGVAMATDPALPSYTMLVGRRSAESGWGWTPLLIGLAVSCAAVYRACGGGGETELGAWRRNRRMFQYLKRPQPAGGPGIIAVLLQMPQTIARSLANRIGVIGTQLSVASGPGLVAGLVQTLLAIARSVAGTVFGASVAGMLHRSAVFLVVFLVVHMLGNLSFLASDDAFNQYGHKLEALRPATTVIELYLLAAAVIHAGTAMLASWRKRSVLLKPKGRWGLALSSIAVTGFLVVHVAQFRFGPGVKDGYSTTVAGSEMRDLARLQREVFSDPAQVGFYLLALGAIGTHVWLGWTKAVPKLAGLPSEHRANALVIGQAMTVAVVLGFAAGPLSALYAT